MFNIIKQTKEVSKEKKEFNLNLAVFKVIGMAFLVIATVMQVKAAFTDNTLVNLEADYRSPTIQEEKHISEITKHMKDLEKIHDVRCNAYRALRAYKESKGYEIKETKTNPCTVLSFQLTEQSEPIQ